MPGATFKLATANTRYRISDLMRTTGDVTGAKYDILNAAQMQIQVNSASPGSAYVGGKLVVPITNCGMELAVLDSSNSNSDSPGNGIVTTADYLVGAVNNVLVNIYWRS